jgi:hypothetical protein
MDADKASDVKNRYSKVKLCIGTQTSLSLATLHLANEYEAQDKKKPIAAA